MRSPSPQLVELFTYVGGSGDDMIPTHLSDYVQEKPITRGSPPFNNFYRSQYAVSQFYGQSTYGSWQFQVRDDVANGQTGTLQAVYLNLCPTMIQFPATVGVYRPSNSAFFLKNQNTGGPADIIAQYGLPQDLPVVGDWEDDGKDTIAVYRNGVFYIRFVNLGGPADLVVPFGVFGDLPVAGDWDGDGDDTVGVFRGGTWFMRNSNTQGPGEIMLGFGLSGDLPVVGDWNGDSRDDVGVFRNGVFYLRVSDSVVYTVPFGQTGDRPVAGDWDGDGLDTIGIYRNAAYYLRNSLTGGMADAVFAYGAVGDDPVTGDWDFRK